MTFTPAAEAALAKAGAAVDAAATAAAIHAAAERARLGSRGYPLPPWADSPARPEPADVLEWLLGLVDDGPGRYPNPSGYDQAVAYLAAWQERHTEAQRLASDRLLKVLDLTSPRPAYRVELDVRELDELGLDVVRLTLAYAPAAKPLDREARARIAEAAAQAAHSAYEREVAAATIVAHAADDRGRGCPCDTTP